ncbi:MAG: hypothetical protein ACMUIA_04980 [bacterium]
MIITGNPGRKDWVQDSTKSTCPDNGRALVNIKFKSALWEQETILPDEIEVFLKVGDKEGRSKPNKAGEVYFEISGIDTTPYTDGYVKGKVKLDTEHRLYDTGTGIKNDSGYVSPNNWSTMPSYSWEKEIDIHINKANDPEKMEYEPVRIRMGVIKVVPQYETYVLATGIGLYVSGSFRSRRKELVEFFTALRDEIQKKDIGKNLISEFNPKNNSQFIQISDPDSQAHFKGITLIISPNVWVRLNGKGDFWGLTARAPAIYTDSLKGLTDSGTVKAYTPDADEADVIPRIIYPYPFQKLFSGQIGSEVSLGESVDGVSRGKLTKDGVKDHPDFLSGETFPHYLVLFHEMCHAHLKQAGITKLIGALDKKDQELDASRVGSAKKNWDEVTSLEEEFVCGFGRALGYTYSENHVRKQAGLAPRKKYTAVGLTESNTNVPSDDSWKKLYPPEGFYNPKNFFEGKITYNESDLRLSNPGKKFGT